MIPCWMGESKIPQSRDSKYPGNPGIIPCWVGESAVDFLDNPGMIPCWLGGGGGGGGGVQSPAVQVSRDSWG